MAAAIYSTEFIFIAIAFNLLWRHASSAAHQRPLLGVPLGSARVLALNSQYRYGPLFYVAALGASCVNAGLGLLLNGALAAFFALPPRERGATG